MKYRKKPVIVEAIEWTGNRDVVDRFMGLVQEPKESNHAYYLQSVIIRTLEGTMAVDIGDWIIKGIKGEFYPCKPDIFELTYEPIINSPEKK